jgi:chromosome segregation ATPase
VWNDAFKVLSGLLIGLVVALVKWRTDVKKLELEARTAREKIETDAEVHKKELLLTADNEREKVLAEAETERMKLISERDSARESLTQANNRTQNKFELELRSIEDEAAKNLRSELRKEIETLRTEVKDLRNEITLLRELIDKYRGELLTARENEGRVRLAFAAMSTTIESCPNRDNCPLRASGMLPDASDITGQHHIPKPPMKKTKD